MSALDRLTGHFERLGRQSIEMPELSEEGQPPFIVYWRPLTVDEHARLFGGEKRMDDRLYAELIVMKAEDAEGRKMFRFEDAPALKTRASRSVLKRIGDAILAVPTQEQAEKN
jgi:hypothetical protein